MRNSLIDNRIRYEFRSVPKLLIHFSFSLAQLISVFAILGLQIALSITQTCVYHIGIGFWSIPFLLIAPVSIWIVIWRRSSIACFIAILTHLIATLFGTSIILISFLVLINEIECSTSSLNLYNVPLNSSFIGIAGVFKIFNYCEIILLCKILRNTSQLPTIFVKDVYERDYPVILNPLHINNWRTWSIVTNDTRSDLSDLFI
jgi:hypothetical protein